MSSFFFNTMKTVSTNSGIFDRMNSCTAKPVEAGPVGVMGFGAVLCDRDWSESVEKSIKRVPLN